MGIAVKTDNIITRMINNFKLKKELENKQKIKFLYRQVFNYYYDIQRPVILSSVDIPEFLYEQPLKERAKEKALLELLYRVADKKEVDRLCTKRINQLRMQRISK